MAACSTFLKPLIDALAVSFITNNIRAPIGPQDPNERKEKVYPFALLGRKRFNIRKVYGWTRSQSPIYKRYSNSRNGERR